MTQECVWMFRENEKLNIALDDLEDVDLKEKYQLTGTGLWVYGA